MASEESSDKPTEVAEDPEEIRAALRRLVQILAGKVAQSLLDEEQPPPDRANQGTRQAESVRGLSPG